MNKLIFALLGFFILYMVWQFGRWYGKIETLSITQLNAPNYNSYLLRQCLRGEIYGQYK